jgi:predicted nucleic acid-binding protein
MSTSRAIVETNWILDVALERNADSIRLLHLAQVGTLELLLPAFCLTETVKALENMQSHWREAENALLSHTADIERSKTLGTYAVALGAAQKALAELKDQAEARVWSTLPLIVEATRSLPLTREIIELTADIRDQLKHTPADSAVLATVIVTNRQEKTPFMSRDERAFGGRRRKGKRQATEKYLEQEGVVFFDSATELLQFWQL